MDKIKQNIDLQEAIQRYNIEKSVVGTLAYNIDQNLQKGMSVDEVIENVLQKAGGEGSRGGKVIGHTKSGKPVYSHSEFFKKFNSKAYIGEPTKNKAGHKVVDVDAETEEGAEEIKNHLKEKGIKYNEHSHNKKRLQIIAKHKDDK